MKQYTNLTLPGDERLTRGGADAWAERARRTTLRLEGVASRWGVRARHRIAMDVDRTDYYRLMVRSRHAEAALVREVMTWK